MEKTSGPAWATRDGMPSAHLLRAALHAGRLIDSQGSAVGAVDLAYIIYPSDGLFPPTDLRVGLQLLVDCDLVFRDEDAVRPFQGLSELVALPDADAVASLLSLVVTHRATFLSSTPTQEATGELADGLGLPPEQREALLLALARRHDDTLDAAIGAMGEDFVVDEAKSQLRALGLDHLVPGVRRVSLISDALGYDVVAPATQGSRRLEVKTSTLDRPGLFSFYLSRSEFEWGLRDANWALIGCRAEGEVLNLVGWCRAGVLAVYLPADGSSGRWESARVMLPETNLQPGLPPPI
ncbi:MAG: hypothetical protein K5799_15150 [Erythrobacter sp.]|nr:hypothetical protein [Erythrobacter sp.]